LGEVINFLDYKDAKTLGVSVDDLKDLREQAKQAITNELFTEITDEYYVYDVEEGDFWPYEYPFVIIEDIETGYHDDCDHDDWSIVEEGYQATCNDCSLNAWSAPW
jgi:hypothetical protein